MGGKIAMCLALRHPELVERLAVVDIARGVRQRAGVRRLHRDDAGLDLDALRAATRPRRPWRSAVPNRVVRSFLLQNLRRTDDGWHWQINLDLLGEHMAELVGWPGERLGDASYDGPVLWVGGARSDYISDDHAGRWTAGSRATAGCW